MVEPSPLHTAGKAANGLINGLKREPWLLALVALNVIAIVIAYMLLKSVAERTQASEAQMMKMIENCMERKS